MLKRVRARILQLSGSGGSRKGARLKEKEVRCTTVSHSNTCKCTHAQQSHIQISAHIQCTVNTFGTCTEAEQ